MGGAIHLLRWLKQLSRSLTVLKLHHLEMQDSEGLHALSASSVLYSIELVGVKASARLLGIFNDCRELREVYIGNCEAINTDVISTFLARHPNLTRLADVTLEEELRIKEGVSSWRDIEELCRRRHIACTVAWRTPAHQLGALWRSRLLASHLEHWCSGGGCQPRAPGRYLSVLSPPVNAC